MLRLLSALAAAATTAPPTDPPCASCKTQKACTASSTYGPSGKAYGHLGCAWNPGNATCVKIPPPPCPGDGCPCLCKDPAMCKSLSPQPPLRDEIFAFSSWVFNGEQDPRTNYTAPANFDFTKITAWAPFEVEETGPNREQYGEMFCKAHESNARVLDWAGAYFHSVFTGLYWPLPTFLLTFTLQACRTGTRQGQRTGEAIGGAA